MARNRMIKPEFWTSEQILHCSRDARLLFIGFWNFADDHGIHPVSFMALRAKVFPGDQISLDEIKELVNELIQQDLLCEYVVDGKSFWIVTGWQTHQKIEKPRYCYPLPKSALNSDESSTFREAIGEESTTHRRLVGSENKGKRKEEEKPIGEVETSPADNNQSSHVHEIFEYWKTVMHHPNAKLDDKRQSKIKHALRNGYTVEQLKYAIEGCANTPHNMGKNDSGQRYDDITLILRDAEHIERFMRNVSLQHMHDGNTSDWMAGVI